MPSRLATDASSLYARNLLNFLTPCFGKDGAGFAFNWSDELINGILLQLGLIQRCGRTDRVVDGLLHGVGSDRLIRARNVARVHGDVVRQRAVELDFHDDVAGWDKEAYAFGVCSVEGRRLAGRHVTTRRSIRRISIASTRSNEAGPHAIDAALRTLAETR